MHGLEHISILPNTVSPRREAIPRRPKSGTFTFLFVGSLDYYPNQDAVMFFCERVLPRLRVSVAPEIIFRVIGGGAGRNLTRLALRTPGVDLLGFVPNLTQAYAAADGVVAPVRAGGGTRMKIVEAFAHAKPVVSTRLGAEGIPARHGVHVLLSDSERQIIEQCVRLVNDPVLGETLAANSLVLVRSIDKAFYEGLLG